MSSTPDSLIMGVAARYSFDMLMPFLKSLRQTSYQGKVCLFVSQMTDETIAKIKRFADEVIVLDSEYGQHITTHHLNGYIQRLAWIRRTRRIRRLYPRLFQATLKLARPTERKRLQTDIEQAMEGFQSLRYRHYQTYLEEKAQHADYVMLTDVRDVIFQDDPFKHSFHEELEVFLEAPHLRIGTEPFNQRWIANLYGADMLHALSERVISCSGTTMGTRAGILRYLRAMTAEILRHERPLGSHDQGVHNYLLYNGMLDPVHIYTNGYSPVLTIGGEREISRDERGCVLNRDGGVAPVVHQYDRHPELSEDLWRSIEQSPILSR